MLLSGQKTKNAYTIPLPNVTQCVTQLADYNPLCKSNQLRLNNYSEVEETSPKYYLSFVVYSAFCRGQNISRPL